MRKLSVSARRIRSASQRMGSMPQSLGWSGLVHCALLFGLGLSWNMYPDTPLPLNVVFIEPDDQAAGTSPDAATSALRGLRDSTPDALNTAYAAVELLPAATDTPIQTAIAVSESNPATAALPPRKAYATANDQDSFFKSYLQQWSRVIEKTGSEHAPIAPNGKRLYGQLELDVVLDSTGNVLSVKLLRSSGNRLIDESAKRIVQLAGPFEPFTEKMLAEFDQLHIARIWRFEPVNPPTLPKEADNDDKP